jgi:hypothetical protein
MVNFQVIYDDTFRTHGYEWFLTGADNHEEEPIEQQLLAQMFGLTDYAE